MRTITIQLDDEQIEQLRLSLRRQINAAQDRLRGLKAQLAQLDQDFSANVPSAVEQPSANEYASGMPAKRIKRGSGEAVVRGALNAVPKTAEAISAETGASIATVRRALNALSAGGGAGKSGDGWIDPLAMLM